LRFPVTVLLACLLLSSPALAQTLASRQSARAPGGDFGTRTLAMINAHRSRHGLAPLVQHSLLQELARQHSQYQASRRRLGPDGYRQRAAKAAAAGLTRRCAENAGRNYRSPEQLFTGWRRSSGHNRNLLRPNLRYAGVSVVGDYSTFFACG